MYVCMYVCMYVYMYVCNFIISLQDILILDEKAEPTPSRHKFEGNKTSRLHVVIGIKKQQTSDL